MSEQDYEKMSASEKKKEDWMNAKWRPMMGWLYMATCTFDFVIFPILWSLLQSIKGMPVTQWNPLTLQGAGLYHIAMGAVLGLAAFGRTQEKIAGANNGGLQQSTPAPSGFGTTNSSSFNSSGFGSTPPAATNFGPQTAPGSNFGTGGFAGGASQVTTGFGGKPAPVQPPDPVL